MTIKFRRILVGVLCGDLYALKGEERDTYREASEDIDRLVTIAQKDGVAPWQHIIEAIPYGSTHQ